jgi:hypothetical protein
MHFLSPNDPTNPRSPDEFFSEQLTALVEAGFSTSLLPYGVVEEGTSLSGIPAGERVIYRGWMLHPNEYARLTAAIQTAEGIPFTTPEEYLACHYLPYWYPLIPEFTPETRVYSLEVNLVQELQALGWESFFIKDYVKSLKTSVGSLIRDPEMISTVLSEMRKYRGEIEGGICVRRVEDLLPETERRYFVIEGQPYSGDAAESIPEVVWTCAERIPSKFFSVDVARRRDGLARIVEVGDGQVSDLVGWSAARFAEIWAGATA